MTFVPPKSQFSDIHDPDLRKASTAADHRTMTLVFVKERTLPSLKEALLAGRTVVWYKDQLIGREELLRPFFDGCVRVLKPTVRSKTNVTVEVQNLCDADIILERPGKAGPVKTTLPARSTFLLKVSISDPKKPVELKYTASNFLIAPATGLPVTLRIPGP